MSATRIRSAAAGLLGVLGLVAGPPLAAAHTDLVASYPAADESVAALPEQVVLEFDEPMRVDEDGLVIRDPGGEPHPAEVLASARNDVYVAVVQPSDGRGRWTVEYEAVSRDGHLVAGTVGFWIGRQAGSAQLGEPSSWSRTLALLLVLLAVGFTALLHLAKIAVRRP